MDEEEEQKFKELLEKENRLIESIDNNGINTFRFDFFNGYIIDTVPTEILNSLSIQLKENFNLDDASNLQSVHYKLAGNIKNQYALSIESKLEHYIFYLCEKYFEQFPNYLKNIYSANALADDDIVQLKICTLWVNFMKKYEFNPPHTHSGRFSFVIWYKIPYLNEDEIKYGPCKRLDDNNLAGCFQFLYPSFSERGIEGTVLRIDKKYEGKIILFPAYLYHSVYPFYTSDEYRISIAGNVKL